MRWNDKRVLGAAALATALAGLGASSSVAAKSKAEKRAERSPTYDPSLVQPETPILGEPYTIAGQKFEPKDDNTFDEVGYSITMTPDMSSGSTMTGESYNPSAITISHRILPVPSYVELTNLETGKTIIARVNDRGPMLKDRVAALSPAAAQLLGIEGTAPIRVRRLNPPMAEKIALRSGRPAPERLDTPPALLSALKRRLMESGTPKPKDVVMTAPAPRAPNPMQAKPQVAKAPTPKPASKPAPKAAAPRAGATFDQGQQPVSAAAPSSDDRFVVEGEGAAPARPARPAQAPVSGAYFVQIAAFGDQSRANALAKRANAQVQSAGSIHRVRVGPFENDAEARAALSDLKRNGYPDARITR
jgi:rare lipoprotein A